VCDRFAISTQQAEEKILVATNMKNQDCATNPEVKIVQEIM
jgi:hypothetical protein